MNFEDFLNVHLSNIEGWCNKDKALKMHDVIVETKPDLCLEIGVFGGSSLIPQAVSLKENGKGLVIGIDPWNNNCAVEEMENVANKNWWGSVDLEGVYKRFLQKLKVYEVEDFVKLYRNKSSEVVNLFEKESIDILHIDGNHCEKLCYGDSLAYYPKVKMGGYIFFDDINWTENSKDVSTKKGLNYLLQFCENLGVIGDDCLLMKKVR